MNPNKELFMERLPLAIQTGKQVYGFTETLNNLQKGALQLIIISNNFPEHNRKHIEYLSMLKGNVPIYSFNGSNNDLGKICQKRFRVGIMGLREFGEADLLSALN